MNISSNVKTTPPKVHVMDNIKLTQLAIDADVKPLLTGKQFATQEQYYKATFSPEFPPIQEFKPNQYFYESLTEDTVSVVGRLNAGGEEYQIGFVLPREIKTGKYDIEQLVPGKVSSHVLADGQILFGMNGQIDLIRAGKSITATFNFEINHNSTLYKIQNGKLSLLATGDL